MKESTIQLIKNKFLNDVNKIDAEIRRNKYEIKKLATKQKELKDTRKGLFEIIRLIKK
jgi:hypothetical protein